MSLTTKNQLLIAFKKLVGKAHTNSQFGSANESVASSVQLDSSTIFSQPIPSAPSSSLYSITNNVVEKIQFSLASISLAQYTAVGAAGGGITMDGDGAPGQGTFSNGIHAYSLKLPNDYEVSSSNPKKGTSVYVNGQSLTASNGLLQIVPEKYGSSYPASVSSSTGILAALDEEDYILDPYAGILFVQDINRVPTSVTAYVYIGDYLNQTVSGTTAQFTTITGSTITGSNAIFNTVTASFTGSGAGLFNLTASGINNFTADVRNRFSAGTGIVINAGVISASNVPNTSLQNSSINLNGTNLSLGGTGSVGIIREIQAGANIGITGGTSATASISLSSSLTGLGSISATTITASVISASSYLGITAGATPGGPNQSVQFNSGSSLSGSSNLIYNFTTNTLSGTTAQFTIITGSHSGSGAGLFNLTASGINNFITDVRGQFSAGTGITINSGVISASNIPNTALQNNSITIGSTNIALGGTSTILTGITSLTASNAFFQGDVRINGTASIAFLQTINEQSLKIGDKYIFILSGGVDHPTLDGSGIQWGSGAIGDITQDEFGSMAHVRYNGIKDKISIFPGLYVSGATGTEISGGLIVTGSTFLQTLSGTTAQFISITGAFNGNGSGITNIPNASLTNSSITVGSTSIALGNTATTIQGLTVITGSTVTGSTALFTTITGSHSGSGAGLFNLTASGISNFTNDVRGQFSAGTNITIVSGVISSTASGSGGGTPGGTNTTVQFNSGSTFSGSTNLVYDYTTNTLSGTTAQFTTITASNFLIYGTASLFTNPQAAYLVYSSGSDKLVAYPGLIVSGNLTASIGQFTIVSGTTAQFTTITGSTVTGSTALFGIVTASFTGSGAGLFNVTASGISNFTSDVRAQFSAGTGITINSGVISASNISNTSLQNSSISINGTNISLGGTGSVGIIREIQAGTNIGITGGTSTTASISLSSSLTGLTSVSATTISGTTVTGSTALFTTITGSHSGSGAGLFNLTASGISNFTADVRGQFTAGTNITIVGGVISSTASGSGGTGSATPGGTNTTVQFNSGSTFSGSTNLIYNYTTNVLSGTTSQFTIITGSIVTGSTARFTTISGTNANISNNMFVGSTITATNIDSTTLDVIGDTNLDNTTIRTGGESFGTLTVGTIGTATEGGIVLIAQDANDVAINYDGDYKVGIDKSDGDNFKISYGQPTSYGLGTINGGAQLGTNDILIISKEVSGSVGIGTSGSLTEKLIVSGNIKATGTGIISGTTAQFTTITGSHTGSGAGLFNLTASGISNFTNDVRGQFSAGTNITIVSGVISSTASGSGGATGSVTSVSVVSANGLAGTVANPTTTPAITLSTSITGLLKGNGTAISAATAGTDYAPAGNYVTTDTVQTITAEKVISVNTAAAALRITQTGAGEALRVEDETNPDSTPFVINASGNVGIGTSSPSQKLTVSGNLSIAEGSQIFAGFGSTSKPSYSFDPSEGGTGLGLTSLAPHDIDFICDGTVRMQIKNFPAEIELLDSLKVTGTGIISGTIGQFTAITGSFSGSGANITSITASNITNFTNDVRGQFTAGTNVSIVGGVISAAGGGGGGNLSTLIVSGNYLLQSIDAYIFTSGTLTLTIPSAIGSAGKLYYIKNISTGTITLTGSLSQTIDGYTDIVIEDKNTMLGLASDGANWTIF